MFLIFYVIRFRYVTLSFHVINEQLPGILQLIIICIGIESADGSYEDVTSL